MNRLRVKYCISLLWGCLAGLTVSAQPMGYYEEIPFEMVRNKIIIPAVVDGIEGRYIFDTGASMCITHSRMEKGPEKDVKARRVIDANGHEMTYNQITTESVKLGTLDFQHVPALVLGEGNPVECYDVDGIIGSNLFRASVVRLDVQKKLLILTDGTERFELNPRAVIPMETNRQNIPFMMVNLGSGQEERVMFDTGSPAFYEMNEPTYQALKSSPVLETLNVGYGALGIGVGGMEKKKVKYRVKLAEFSVGMGKFRNVISGVMRGPGSRVGAGLLKHGVITLDFPGQKLYFEPYKTEPVDLFRKDWNVAVTVSGDSLIVGCVWKSMQDQLKGGEKVVAVNGQRVEKIDPCQALTSSIVKMEGEEATITIIDAEGIEKDITIRKE